MSFHRLSSLGLQHIMTRGIVGSRNDFLFLFERKRTTSPASTTSPSAAAGRTLQPTPVVKRKS